MEADCGRVKYLTPEHFSPLPKRPWHNLTGCSAAPKQANVFQNTGSLSQAISKSFKWLKKKKESLDEAGLLPILERLSSIISEGGKLVRFTMIFLASMSYMLKQSEIIISRILWRLWKEGNSLHLYSLSKEIANVLECFQKLYLLFLHAANGSSPLCHIGRIEGSLKFWVFSLWDIHVSVPVTIPCSHMVPWHGSDPQNEAGWGL